MNDIAALALQRHRTYFSQCEATRGAFYLQEDTCGGVTDILWTAKDQEGRDSKE